jgi:hypothetical protein
VATRWTNGSTIRILDFDIETRRVGFHSAGRFAPDGCEPVAIAASWVGEKNVRCWVMPDAHWPVRKAFTLEMLRGFRRLWDEAGIVSGHYIRKFDLPIINGALLEHGLPLLTEKLTCDTKGDLKDRAGLSASQENLSLMLHLEENKFHMSDANWRAVARLQPDAMEACRKRVMDDVRQHKVLRERLLGAGALKSPRVWRP